MKPKKVSEKNYIGKTNSLLKASSMLIGKEVGLKSLKKGQQNNPWWKKINKVGIKQLRVHVNILEKSINRSNSEVI